jgi:phosphohistidine phosphatase SixA
MNLYLMRHCEPVAGEWLNSERSLNEAGREQAQHMSQWLRNQIGRVDIVISSPFAAAVQTAEIMAEALGSYVATTTMLEPDRSVEEAWADVLRLMQQAQDILVITDSPLVGFMLDAFGTSPPYGAMAAFDTQGNGLNWLVTPGIISRETAISVQSEEAAVLADALEVADCAVNLAEALERRSLQHPDHAKLIKPIVRRVKKLIAGYFEKQGEAILKDVRPWLKLHMQEADDASKSKALDILPDSVSPLVFAVTKQESDDYRAAIQDAIRKAENQLESELQSGARISQSTMTQYLEENSLAKLTGDLSDATKSRLRSAIAESVASGGTAEDIEAAITDTIEEFSDARARLVAQTEINQAYNWSRTELAKTANLTEKSWVTENPAACIECVANEAQGWIPIDEEFQSGDQFPVAHPGCFCSTDFRTVVTVSTDKSTVAEQS